MSIKSVLRHLLSLPLAIASAFAQPAPGQIQSVQANNSTGALVSPTAFSKNLVPSMAGQSGKLLGTDGTTAAWQAAGSGSGTVTTASVVTANGISATVANPTTTPAFTFTLGAITPTSVNGLTITSTTGTFTLTNAKVFSVANTLTLAGTDGSTLNVGTGGALGTAAYTAASAYEVPLTFSGGVTRSTNTITVDAATTSAAGKVQLATSAQSETGTSTTLVETVDGAARTALGFAPTQTGFRNSFPTVNYIPATATAFNLADTSLVPSKDMAFGKRLNVWQYSENLGHATYSAGSATKDGTDTIVVAGITLGRFTGSSFYSMLSSNVSGLGLTPYTSGKRYLVSCYILSLRTTDQFVMMRQLADGGAAAHGSKLINGTLRRIWILGQATSTTALDYGDAAATALGGGSGDNPRWIFGGTPTPSGSGTDTTLDLYIGGFQVEQTSDTAKDGVAGIGDSTMQGGQGTNDSVGGFSWFRFAAGLTNATWFNRGVSGNTTTQMVARWTSDMTPLAARSKYAVIQGGVNDFGNSVALATVETNIASMVASAKTDGMIPIVCTCTPSGSVTGSNETNRQTFNRWVRETYPLVFDLAKLIEDPLDGTQWRRDADWTADGIHPTVIAQKAIASYVAGLNVLDLPKPGPYQPIAVQTFTPPALTLGTATTAFYDAAGKIFSTSLNTVGVAQGGTAAISLTGLVRGSGTSAMTAAELSGDVTTSGSNVTTLAAGSASNLNSGTLLAARMPALTGDVTTSAGAVATTIGAGKVTNTMLAGSIDLTTKVTGVLPAANVGLTVAPAFNVETDGSTITITCSATKAVQNSTVTLGGLRTLAISGAASGMTGVLIVKQDATGSRGLALPSGSKVVGGGGGAVSLTATANAIDILTWVYDGTNYFWTLGKNFN